MHCRALEIIRKIRLWLFGSSRISYILLMSIGGTQIFHQILKFFLW